MLNTFFSSSLPESQTMARAGLSISLSAIAAIATAQVNLVPNWSFEDTGYCDMPVQWPIQKAPPWFSANYATPDVYSMEDAQPCGVYMDTSDVIGQWCFQAPFHGDRFAGQYLWEDGGELKEYMQVQLLESLQAGRSYRVAMKVSLPECWRYAVDGMGAYFSPDTVFDPTLPIPGVLPVAPQAQFHEPLFYTDEVDWMHLVDTIIAAGGERFMVIGSFTDAVSTNVLPVTGIGGFNSAYYYFDAIEVVDVTVEDLIDELMVAWYAGGLLVNWPNGGKIEQIRIVDTCGRELHREQIKGTTSVMLPLIEHYATGTYIIHAQSGRKWAFAKWLKMK